MKSNIKTHKSLHVYIVTVLLCCISQFGTNRFRSPSITSWFQVTQNALNTYRSSVETDPSTNLSVEKSLHWNNLQLSPCHHYRKTPENPSVRKRRGEGLSELVHLLYTRFRKEHRKILFHLFDRPHLWRDWSTLRKSFKSTERQYIFRLKHDAREHEVCS